jgi:hypothetical protein
MTPAGLSYAGGRTSIAPALDRVREELGALPLSGVVLVTDGADAGADVPDRGERRRWPSPCSRCARRECPCFRSASAASRSTATSS